MITLTAIPDGLWGYLTIIAIAVLVHEPWRWLGVYLSRDVELGSAIFDWVRAVAIALVAALVMRLALFPAGALAGIPTGVRVAALAVGLAAFYASRGRVAPGVLAGAAMLIVGDLIFGR